MNCGLEYVDANVENDFMDIDLPHGDFVADLNEIPRNFQFSISLGKIMLKLSDQFNVREVAINFFISILVYALKENDQFKIVGVIESDEKLFNALKKNFFPSIFLLF